MFAQDEGGNGLVGYADVQVNLKDINDNAPLFPHGEFTADISLERSKPQGSFKVKLAINMWNA